VPCFTHLLEDDTKEKRVYADLFGVLSVLSFKEMGEPLVGKRVLCPKVRIAEPEKASKG